MSMIEQGSGPNLSPILVGVNINPYSIVGNGAKDVASAGTPVALAVSTPTKTITVRAKVSNTGLIYIGSTTMTAADGFQLSPDETVSLDLDNLSKLFIDAAVSGNGVTYIYLA